MIFLFALCSLEHDDATNVQSLIMMAESRWAQFCLVPRSNFGHKATILGHRFTKSSTLPLSLGCCFENENAIKFSKTLFTTWVLVQSTLWYLWRTGTSFPENFALSSVTCESNGYLIVARSSVTCESNGHLVVAVITKPSNCIWQDVEKAAKTVH